MVLSAVDLTVRDVGTEPANGLPSAGRLDLRRGCSDGAGREAQVDCGQQRKKIQSIMKSKCPT